MLMLCLLLGASAAAQHGVVDDPTEQPLLRIIANDFVLPGKLAKIASWAREAGVRMESVSVETAPGEPQDWLVGADLVILDTPRRIDLAMVQERMGAALNRTDVPWIRVGGGPPTFDHLAPDHARRLIAYYANGGETNLRRMLTYVRHWHDGRDVASLPPAIPLPKSGFYHPEAAESFATLEAYLNWGASR